MVKTENDKVKELSQTIDQLDSQLSEFQLFDEQITKEWKKLNALWAKFSDDLFNE